MITQNRVMNHNITIILHLHLKGNISDPVTNTTNFCSAQLAIRVEVREEHSLSLLTLFNTEKTIQSRIGNYVLSTWVTPH